jgi:hypothetical protein
MLKALRRLIIRNPSSVVNLAASGRLSKCEDAWKRIQELRGEPELL